MMEKEKKTKKTQPKTKTSTIKQPAATDQVEPKKAAITRKKAGPVAVPDAAPKTTSDRKKPTPAMTAMNVSHEEIARLAHRYWAERGHKHGHHVEDWLRAERELFGKAS